MKPAAKHTLFSLLLFCLSSTSKSQEAEPNTMFGIFTGLVNYQGDLQPSSFTFDHSRFAFGLNLRKPLNRWLSFRAGFNIAKIEAADRHNRDYLVKRNLSFYTSIKELNAGFEINLLDMSTKRFSPYLYGGVSVFQFNPWTYDETGNKVFLQPLGTEGQGLAEYPDRKKYKRVQPALAFGGGARIALNDDINVGVEFNQRKTFTDYLDDVSTTYADQNLLLAANGQKAVDLAWRGDEVPGGSSYPHAGEQRGTPTEMDWYYFIGIPFEIKLQRVLSFKASSSPNYTRCPSY